MRTQPATVVAAIVATCAICLPGCAIDADREPTVDSRVIVLPAIAGMVVTDTTVTLPRAAAPELAPGQIIVSAQGEGFLRAIDATAATGDAITLTTHDADLSEALIDCQLTTELGGAGKADTYQLPAIHFGVRDKTILDNEAITVRIVDSSLALEPALQLDISIEDRRLTDFTLALEGRLTGEITLDVDALTAHAGPTITLWESPKAIFYQQIGPVPVAETISTSVVLKLDAVTRGQGQLRIDAGAIASLAAGLHYDPANGWQRITDLDVDTHGSIPVSSVTLEQAGIHAWLAARADVRLYGVAGPYVAVGPQLEVVRDLGDGSFDGSVGFRGQVGGEIKVLRLNVPALPSFELFDVVRPIP